MLYIGMDVHSKWMTIKGLDPETGDLIEIKKQSNDEDSLRETFGSSARPLHGVMESAVDLSWNTAFLYINDTTDTARLEWNGSIVFSGVVPDLLATDTGRVRVGASNYWGTGGTSAVTFDWVGWGNGMFTL